MAQPTPRDEVWNAALRLGADGWFNLDDVLAEVSASEHTTRQVLEVMEGYDRLKSGWIATSPNRRLSWRVPSNKIQQ